MKPAKFDPLLLSAVLTISACLLVCGAGFHAIYTKQDSGLLIVSGLILCLGSQLFARALIKRSR